MKKYIPVFMHILELVALLVLVYIATLLFPSVANHPAIQATVLIILGGAVKFARTSDTVPVPDYVNKFGESKEV